MGFGLPAAMGVKQAFPDAHVACVTGEASIQMCIQELATCKQYDLPDQDHSVKQRLHGHGSPVARVLLRWSLLKLLR